MKIIYLTCERLDKPSSVGNHILEICQHLQKFGHKIKIIAAKSNKTVILNNNNLDVTFIPTTNIKIFHLLAPFFLLREVIKKKYDILYTRFFSFEINCVFIAKLWKMKYVLELNGALAEEMKILKGNKWKIEFSKIVEKICYSLADGIIVVADGLREYLKQYGNFEKKIIEISNGVNPEIVIPMDKKKCRLTLKLDPASYYICFIGSFGPWQRIEITIKTIKILLNNGTKITMLIVGSGKDNLKYKQLCQDLKIENSVIFAGRIDYDKIKYYLGASDICFFPLRYKYGLAPLKMFDAMAAARPIVTTNIGGLKKLVEDNGVGLVVNSNNPEEFAKVISFLLKNEDKMTLLGNRGRYLAENVFSWNNIARRTESFLFSLNNNKLRGIR